MIYCGIILTIFAIAGAVLGFLSIKNYCYGDMDATEITMGLAMGFLCGIVGFLVGLCVMGLGSIIPASCADTEWVIEERYNIASDIILDTEYENGKSVLAYNFLIDTEEFGEEPKSLDFETANIKKPSNGEKPEYIKYRKQYKNDFLRKTFFSLADDKYVLVADDDLIQNKIGKGEDK